MSREQDYSEREAEKSKKDQIGKLPQASSAPTKVLVCNRSACRKDITGKGHYRIWNDPSRTEPNVYCPQCGSFILNYPENRSLKYETVYGPQKLLILNPLPTATSGELLADLRKMFAGKGEFNRPREYEVKGITIEVDGTATAMELKQKYPSLNFIVRGEAPQTIAPVPVAVTCPNDTDGDGDCHLCYRQGGCFNKPPEAKP